MFLSRSAYEARSALAVEIGTGSGFSTAVLCHALHFASADGLIDSDFRVVTYDISPTVYGIPTKRVGDAAREILTPTMLGHIEFRSPAGASDANSELDATGIEMMFVDGHHAHPWPTLDLLATLDALRPGAVVVLHDINLPRRHPQHDDWGAKYLFDGVHAEKQVPANETLPNIGSLKIPSDKAALRTQLCEIVDKHPWQREIPEHVLEKTLRR